MIVLRLHGLTTISLGGGKLYIPPKHFEADVTTRYFEWWKKQSVLNLQETSKDVLEEQRSFTNFEIRPKRSEGMKESDVFTSFKMIPKSLKRPKEDDTCFGFKMMPKKFKGMREANCFPDSKIKRKTSKRAKQGTSASTRPDFHLRSLKRSHPLLKQKEKGNNSTSDLGSPLKRFAQYPKLKMVVQNAGFPPKGNMLRAKGSVNEDKVTANSSWFY
ncbi:hypothetical protein REPUB_Repub18cG0022000 [Reevesia pubescens]